MTYEVLKGVAEKYSTPAYVFDADILCGRIRMIQKHMGKRVSICYAMKANPFLIRPILGTIDCYEVCSPGEFSICEKAGIPMEQIVLSGVNKAREDIWYALGTYGGKGIFTIESIRHLTILEECAAEKDLVIRALVRVSSGNQFGLDQEEVLKLFARRKEYPHVELQGLQYYSGTQKKKRDRIEREIDLLDELILRIEKETGIQIRHLEYGPGFSVPYFTSDREQNDKELLDWFAETLEQMRFRGEITLEMGRYIAAYCGYYLTEIVDKKVNCGQNYCIADGGIHHLNYYGQMMGMKIPRVTVIRRGESGEVAQRRRRADEIGDDQKEQECWNICGSLCTVSDVIVKQLPVVSPEIGDVLVFERTGAYSVTEGMSLFLSRDLPQIFLYTEKEGVRMIRGARRTCIVNQGEHE